MSYLRYAALFSFMLALLPDTVIYAKECKAKKAKVICQKDIPFVIKKSGKYKLGQNITFRGSGAAITIKANDVKLELENFSISLTGTGSTGILVTGVSEFVIKNDAIKNASASTGTGIHVINSNKGSIEEIFTLNNLNGLVIEESSDIEIEESQFFSANGAGASVVASTNIVFHECVFSQCGNGLKFSGANQDCSINKCEFPSANFSNLLVQQINGMLVENCSFTNAGGDPTKANLVQFGDADPTQVCFDVIFKNCTIVNRPPHEPVLGNTAPEGLGIYQGSGFLVQSCVIDIDNTNQDPAADLSGIHISNPGLGAQGTVASNVLIQNCVVQGPATDGFYPDVGSSGVVIENCVATGAQKDGIFLAGTTASKVQNNLVVNNGTNGIFLGEVSSLNAVLNNTVTNNGFNPITSSLPPLGNGIAIASDSFNNTVQYNQSFNNAVNGVDDEGNGNQTYFNTAYGNGNQNYHSTTDIIIVSAPGDNSKSAENIAP